MKLKAKKCNFAKQQITYLGHIISSRGVEPDSKKLAAVTTYPIRYTTKEVKQFMGLSNYYHRFIPNYTQITEPLHRLLRKTAKGFNWTPECDASFTLKSKLASPLILAYPNFTAPFLISTNASDTAIGGVLSQVQGGQDRIIAY